MFDRQSSELVGRRGRRRYGDDLAAIVHSNFDVTLEEIVADLTYPARSTFLPRRHDV